MSNSDIVLPRVEEGAAIPRIIHQTFPTKDLPPALLANADRLRSDNPGWDYRLYDDLDIEALILAHYGSAMLAEYRRIDPSYGAARADLFRYLLMYAVGGVYLDIKSSSHQPLDRLREVGARFLLARWDNRAGGRHPNWGLHPELEPFGAGEFQQWHIVCAPGHPFLRAVLERVLHNMAAYRPWVNGVGRDGVIRLTGPIAYTLSIAPLVERHDCKLFADESDMGLDYSVVPGTSHKQLFRKHYVNNTASVVRMRGMKRPVAAAYSLGKRLRGMAGRGKARLSAS
ncbi:MAG TPA: glycosyltransferase [Allosphingosinicella sp.]|jgi:hypothetical protein